MNGGDVPTVVMWSLAQISARDKISRAAVSKAIKKLLQLRPDTPHERGPQNEVRRISLADWDHYRERFAAPTQHGEAFKPLAEPISGGTKDLGQGFDEARRQSEWLKVVRLELEAHVAAGRLVACGEIEGAVAAAGRAIRAIVARLPNWADDIARGVSSEGAHGARLVLRDISDSMVAEMLKQLETISEIGPEKYR
jgi:hypothetical protein